VEKTGRAKRQKEPLVARAAVRPIWSEKNMMALYGFGQQICKVGNEKVSPYFLAHGVTSPNILRHCV
jgi:hypothetical protein